MLKSNMNELFVYLIFAVKAILGTADVAIPVSYVIIIAGAVVGLVLITVLIVVMRRNGYRQYLNQVQLDKSPEPEGTYLYSTVEKPTRQINGTAERNDDNKKQEDDSAPRQDAYVYSTVQKSVKRKSGDALVFSITDPSSEVLRVPNAGATGGDAATNAELQQRSSAGNYDSTVLSNSQIIPHPNYDHVTLSDQSEASTSDDKCVTFSVVSGPGPSTGYEMVELG